MSSRSAGELLEVAVVTYGWWGGHNSNSIALCGTWGVLVATVGYMKYSYVVVVSDAEVLPPNCWRGHFSLPHPPAGSVSGSFTRWECKLYLPSLAI